MMMYAFPHLLGTVVLDKSFHLIEIGEEKRLKKKYPHLQTLPKERLSAALAAVKKQQYFSDFFQKNIEVTKQALRDCLSEDQLIIQTMANITELDRTCNLLTKRLREWFSWYYPELSEEIPDHQAFAALLLERKKPAQSMGAEVKRRDLEEMQLLAREIARLYELRKSHEAYLHQVMQEYCPNLLELAGTTIGARLLELAKSLKHLALLPASTVQLLGAEKALFRHLRTGSRSPKYGVIHAHQIVQQAKREQKGKAARMLADKLSLCARLDYFKGELKAKEYRKELEKKLSLAIPYT